MKCPLCKNSNYSIYFKDKQREYYQCLNCALVFVPPHYYVSKSEEKDRYDEHNNSDGDSGYSNFLKRIFIPLHERLAPGLHGLDFGCGPGPVLGELFQSAGYTIDLYDPNYYPNHKLLKNTYDFITATEVIEHLHHPATILPLLIKMLKPKGYLGVMTQPLPDKAKFNNWYYKNDKTHVGFYSIETIRWISKKWMLHVEIIEPNVFIFQKE